MPAAGGGKGVPACLGADEAVSGEHQDRDASVWAEGTVGQSPQQWQALERKNQPSCEATQPSEKVSSPGFSSLLPQSGEVLGEESAETNLHAQLVPTPTSLSLERGVRSSAPE